MEDKISRIICEEVNLRIYTVTSLNTVREITEIHGTTPNAAYALGRAINAAALLSSTLKPGSHQNITIKFKGSGPIREVHVQADAKGNLRGYIANPHVDLTDNIGEINFSKLIGAGFLTVTKDMGLKEPYNSIIPLQSGEIAGDIAYYLTASEQIPSALILGLKIGKEGIITSSGGILIQSLPNTDERVLKKVENNIMNMNQSLSDALDKNNDIIEIVSKLLNNKILKILDTYDLKHSCRCSRELIASILKGLHNDELEDMIEKDGGAEISCTFCKKRYKFSKGDLKLLIKKTH